MVDVDLIDGLATKETAVDYLKRATKADGIISSNPFFCERRMPEECLRFIGSF